jgi:hypothetical protein
MDRKTPPINTRGLNKFTVSERNGRGNFTPRPSRFRTQETLKSSKASRTAMPLITLATQAIQTTQAAATTEKARQLRLDLEHAKDGQGC